MNETNPTVTEADLHAYADGQLAEADRARIEAWLKDNPDEAAAVAEWQSQSAAIQKMFGPYAAARPDDALLVTPRGARPSWPRRAAIAAYSANASAVRRSFQPPRSCKASGRSQW